MRQHRHANIAQVVADLEGASRGDLVDQWKSVYRCAPPKGVGRRFLIGAVAHAEQMRAAGHSRSRMRRRLDRVAKHASATKNGARSARPKLVAGARLVREWNGSSHTVDVLEDDYRWNGAQYRSLSAIARAITGTRWSGPRFFGIGRESAR
jgi:hypothetical protein